jgi:hypothetical protein
VGLHTVLFVAAGAAMGGRRPPKSLHHDVRREANRVLEHERLSRQECGAPPTATSSAQRGGGAPLRRLRPTDRDHLAAAFTRLSATTRADRFLTGMPRLPTMMLDKLIDDVDGHRHVALVLIATPPWAPQVPIAVGRFVRAGPWDCSGR